MGYSYYDTPEGEDCFKKLWYMTKSAAGIGVIVSTFDVILYSKPQGYYQTVARYLHHTVPLVGMAAAFSTTVCIAASVRKKDDELNYLYGGIAAGCVGGKWLKSGYRGFQLALVLGMVGILKKHFVKNNYLLFQSVERERGNLTFVRHDYSLTKERPRDWVVSKNSN